ncbi:aldo/keto reductase [Paenibacillus sp. IB182496]|uniref:Aldo/keto reductase n=1 Tax=Paenibacillus sabuli TaxID=2772509 RepID=A0A927GV16_9BACL|nr:aldo/keto reductase [Paenibacillus sabuli]MBD2848282.1 aldo/keto reductase [Paenibacillus sabuli]
MQTIMSNGLRISRMTLGTVQLGLPYGVANRTGKPDERQSAEMLEAALAGGVNCFDTAQMYGDSELILGRCFAHREPPVLVSKIVLELEKEENAASVERKVLAALERSLERLRLRRIPIMLLHWPHVLLRHGSLVTAAFERAVRAGYADQVGVSLPATDALGFAELWPTLRHEVYGAVQIAANLFDQRLLGEPLELLRQAGKTVFVRSLFLQGLLLMEPDRLPPHLEEAAPYLRQLARLAEREGCAPAELAVGYVRDRPGVHSLVIGADNTSQVEANIRLVETPPLREETAATVARLFADVPDYLISPHLWK